MARPMFFLMPQWQGSPSARAMQLAEGAELLREDLPASALCEVAVPLEAGDAMGTPVARLSSLIRAREAARRAIEPALSEGRAPVIMGGDCATSLAGVEAAARSVDRLAVLWFDAHPDLQHPSTSPSGSASGMTLRHALGDGSADLRAAPAVDADAITLVGARAIDPEEEDELQRLGVPVLRESPADGGDDGMVSAILDRISGTDGVYIHIDLDVLDPAEFSSVHSPVPFGMSVAQLTGAIRAAVAEVPLVGAAICEFAPADRHCAAEDLPAVLRTIAALTSGSAPRAARAEGASA